MTGTVKKGQRKMQKRDRKYQKWIVLGMLVFLIFHQGTVLHARATGQDNGPAPAESSGGNVSGAVMMQVASKVNVRKEADIRSESLGMLEEGTVIFVTGTQGEWRQILYQGQNGYIREDFLISYGSDKEELTQELEEATEKGQTEHQRVLEEEEAARAEAEKAELEAQMEREADEEAKREEELEKQRLLEEAEKQAEENRNKTRRNMGLIIAAAAALIAGYAAVQIYKDRHQRWKDGEDDLDEEEDDWEDDIVDLSGEEEGEK